MSFFSEFRRRNVPQVAIAYLAGAWLLIQVAETLLPIFGHSENLARPFVILLAIGFVPALILAWVFEWTPQGIRRDDGAVAGGSRGSSRTLDRVIISLLLLAVGYFAVDKFMLGAERSESHEQSIVVLPFINMSADREQEYFGDGMAEELLNLLSKVDGLRVISRSTAWTFKGRDVGVGELREKLDVSHVLEGSVRKSGNQVRVTAQLIDARTDSHLWSATYDGTLDDVFEIQDRISSQIVDELRIRLSTNMPVAREIDPVAYELFLRARYIQRSDNEAAYDDALAMLEEALALEPDYVPALFELAVIVWLDAIGDSDEMKSAGERARAIVERMAEIAPESSYTNAWQSYIASEWENDLARAARHLERAIADDPHSPPQVLIRTASVLSQMGRPAEAYAVARYNASRDPACVVCATMMAFIARETGHQRDAAAYLEALLEWHPLTPNLAWQLGAALLAAGEPQKALKWFDAFTKDDIQDFPGDLGRIMALYDLGRIDEYRAEFAAYRETHSDFLESIARVNAWTGNNDAAFEYLEKFIESEGPENAKLAKTDLYSRLRSDPRYDAFLEKYGYADKDYSHVEFNPPYPPAMRAEIERLMASVSGPEARR